MEEFDNDYDYDFIFDYDYDFNFDYDSDYDYLYFNLTNITFDSQEHLDEVGSRLKILRVMASVAVALGALGNGLLLLLFSCTPHLRTTPNILLVQRAVADLILTITTLMHVVFIDFLQYPGVCAFYLVIRKIEVMASCGIIMSFALNQYQTSDPVRFKPQYRWKTMRVTSVLSWISALLVGLLSYLLIDFVDGHCKLRSITSSHFLNKLLMSATPYSAIIVVWVMVSVMKEKGEERGDSSGPNRLLVIALGTIFTYSHGVSTILHLIGLHLPFAVTITVTNILSSIDLFKEALNAVVVLCLAPDVRQTLLAYLPSRRRSHAIILQDI